MTIKDEKMKDQNTQKAPADMKNLVDDEMESVCGGGIDMGDLELIHSKRMKGRLAQVLGSTRRE